MVRVPGDPPSDVIARNTSADGSRYHPPEMRSYESGRDGRIDRKRALSVEWLGSAPDVVYDAMPGTLWSRVLLPVESP